MVGCRHANAPVPEEIVFSEKLPDETDVTGYIILLSLFYLSCCLTAPIENQVRFCSFAHLFDRYVGRQLHQFETMPSHVEYAEICNDTINDPPAR